MKKMWVLVIVIGIGSAAAAQPKINRDGVRNLQPRTKVVRVVPSYPIRIMPVRPYYGLGYGLGLGYGMRSSFYSPFYGNSFYEPRRVEYTPSELQLELDDIENEFSYQISSARKDKSVSGKERREKIRELRHRKEDAIIEAKKAYLKRDDTFSK